MSHYNTGMLDITLPFAINDFEGRELFAAGSILNEAAINAIATLGRQEYFAAGSLLEHGNIQSDLEALVRANPYEFIFGGSDDFQGFLQRVGEVAIPLPLLSALDYFRENDFYTYRHSLIVFALTTFMMEKMSLGKAWEKSAFMVGPTHDIGKRSVPTDILLKNTLLTRHERNHLEFHTISGYVLLSYYFGNHQHPAAQVAFNHHERRDGSGYPRGIPNVDPLVEVVATCDVYDALIASRPYRKGNYDNRAALEELSAIAETGALDMYCVQTLVGRNRSGHPPPDQVKISLEKRGTTPISNCYAQVIEE